MYSVRVEGNFSSAHNLSGYKGKCEALHGHNWKVRLEVTSDTLDKTGMVLDFQFLKTKLNQVLEKLDHRYLNNIPYFKKTNPTSENIAQYIYQQLKTQIPRLNSVTVWESDNACATYDGK